MLTNTYHPSMFSNSAKWISSLVTVVGYISVILLFSCQTYEGGFSAVPGTEAHGGYSFCGFAALVLLQESSLCDIYRLLVSDQLLYCCMIIN